MRFFEKDKKFFNSTEEIVSMFLGLVIVVVVIGLVFTFFQKRKGDITLPGVSNYLDISESDTKIKEDNKVENSVIYTVAVGDNLWKIAEKRYGDGFKWNEIAKMNNLNNPRVITIGQKLIMPTALSADQNQAKIDKPTVSLNEYVVVRNDSLWKIAVSQYGDGNQWTKIWNNNKGIIKDPGVIYAGTKLLVPKLSN